MVQQLKSTVKTKIMKTLYALFFSVLTFSVTGQNCSNLISNTDYQAGFNNIAVQSGDDAKLTAAVSLLNSRCFTADQVKLLTQLFSADGYKLEFAKAAYENTFDRINYYNVYDAFANISTAFRLHDYINGIADTSIEDTVEEAETVNNDEVEYPDINYPSPVKYKGLTGCEVPIADNDFFLLAESVVKQPTDEAIMQDARNLSGRYCLSMAHVMMIASQIQMESNRLQFMKDVFGSTYDMANYGFGTAVFSHVPYQNEWLIYAGNQLTILSTPETPPCDVSSDRFNEMKESINSLTWPDEKKDQMFSLINNEANCFTIEQVRWFMQFYSFDDDRMEVAQAAYKNCLEPADYYKLSGEFTFSSSKDNFFEWLDKQ